MAEVAPPLPPKSPLATHHPMPAQRPRSPFAKLRHEQPHAPRTHHSHLPQHQERGHPLNHNSASPEHTHTTATHITPLLDEPQQHHLRDHPDAPEALRPQQQSLATNETGGTHSPAGGHSPVSPSHDRTPLSRKLLRHLVNKPTLARTWEKRNSGGDGMDEDGGRGDVEAQRSAPLPREHGGRSAWRESQARPTSFYASPAAVAAFRTVPLPTLHGASASDGGEVGMMQGVRSAPVSPVRERH